MNPLTAAFASSLGAALILTPLAMVVARRLGVVDRPDRQLKKHGRAVPYLGGAAIFLACVATVLAFKLGLTGSPRGVVGILAGAGIVFLVGLWDDIRPMGPYKKLVLQILAALIPIYFGVHIKFIDNPLYSKALTVLWLVGVTNALNLLDIMDGLAAGIATIASIVFLVISAQNGRFNDALLASSLAGACAGFLFYNRPPARIFMGDAGSLFTGFMLAGIAIGQGYSMKTEIGVFAPLLVLGVPIFETLFVMAIRAQKGKPVMRGSPDHIPLRIRKMGFSVRATLAILWGSGAVLGVLALMVIHMNWKRALLTAVAAAFAGMLAAIRLASVNMEE